MDVTGPSGPRAATAGQGALWERRPLTAAQGSRPDTVLGALHPPRLLPSCEAGSSHPGSQPGLGAQRSEPRAVHGEAGRRVRAGARAGPPLSPPPGRGLGAAAPWPRGLLWGSQTATYRIKVERAGAHEGDSVVQVVVVHAVLVVLEGGHGEGEGAHAARAPVGQPHLQTHGVAHPAGRGLTVAWLSVHQHICKGHRTQSCRGRCPAASLTSLPFPPSLAPSHTEAAAAPCRLGAVAQSLLSGCEGARAVTRGLLEGPGLTRGLPDAPA